MKRTDVRLKSFKEAEDSDIIQQISLTSEERQEIAKTLKQRVYGNKVPDIRDMIKPE